MLCSLLLAQYGGDADPEQGILGASGLCSVCCFGLRYEARGPKALRVIALILALLLMVPASILSFFRIMLSDFGAVTVVQSVPSPDGSCIAELIDDDQGGMGGNTYVWLRFTGPGWKLLQLLGVQVTKNVYSGGWGEFEKMTLSWKDDHCLLINSKEYPIH